MGAVVREPRLPDGARKASLKRPSGRRARPRWGSPRLVLAGLAGVFIALSLYTTLANQPGRYVPDARLEQVVAPEQNLERQAYLWDDERTLGTPASPYFFSPATSAFQAAVSSLGAEAWVLERLTHALYLSLAALGVILLMREFRPRIGIEHAVAAFVYAFSPFTSQFLLPSGLFLCYALAPWFAWIALRGVRDDDPWRWAAAFALALAVPGSINGAALGFALVPAALTVLYFSLVDRYDPRRLWRWTWRAGLLGALTCSAAIVVLALSGPEVSASLSTSEPPQAVGRTSSWSESWRGLGFWLTYFFDSPGHLYRSQGVPYFTEPAVVAASFLAALGALLALALGRWRHRLLFGAMLLVSLLLMVGVHEAEGPSPFGRLLSFTFDHSQFALGFRSTYKAGPGLMLAIAVLLGVGVASLVAAASHRPPGGHRSRRTSSDARPLVLGVAVPVLVAVGLVVGSSPFWSERLYPDAGGYRSIPRYWKQTFSYLGAQEQPSRVLVLPGGENAHYRWGDVHDSLFDGLSPATPLINRALQQGTAESADLVVAIDEYVSSPGYVKGTLAPILERLGVRWVLVQNDLDWQRMRGPRPSTYDALRADAGLRLAATFGRRGANTAASGDPRARFLAEDELPPVELYEVRSSPSPRPRLVAAPPLMVAGGGDSWPSLAAAGLLDGPPIAYTGAAGDEVLREMVASGAGVVVTDGNRRRATQGGTARRSLSPTLAGGEQSDQVLDLFGRDSSQSIASYADATRISASRYGYPLTATESAARPANAFDGVKRSAWTVRGPLDPGGEWVGVEFRKPVTVTGVSVLPDVDGSRRLRAADLILHSEDGGQTRGRLRFDGALPARAQARIRATGVNEIELRIVQADGPGQDGLAGVGIAEVGVTTPDGPLDLREFVRAPDDLAARAARDVQLRTELAARPPRYELRRVTGFVGNRDEETELRREVTTFGDHRYRLSATARIDDRSAESAIDDLLAAPAGAEGTSRFNGTLSGRGGHVVDDDLSTGWEPNPRVGESVDLHFPPTEVRTVDVLVVSGPKGGAERSRITQVDVAVGDEGTTAHSILPPTRPSRRCPPGGCLERHVVRVLPTSTDHLSVTVAGLETVAGRFGEAPLRVVEVLVNGREWPQATDPAGRDRCAPLFAIDGRPVPVGLPRKPDDLLEGRLFGLEACEPIRLGPGRHRIETLPGLSGAVLTASLVPLGERRASAPRSSPGGSVRLVDSSPTRLGLRINAPMGALLVGGMPSHPNWTADGGDLRRTPVPLDTFAAWRVDGPTAGPVTLRFGPQRIYELAMALSIAAAAWCLWRVTRRRRTIS